MALIEAGSIDDLSARLDEGRVRSSNSLLEALKSFNSFRSLKEAARSIQPVPIRADVSPRDIGVGIQSIKLLRGFDGLLADVFNSPNQVYFLAWSWDLSGASPTVYPSPELDVARALLPLIPQQERRFLGIGEPIAPPRPIVGGLGLNIQVWESDADLRAFGQTMQQVAQAVRESSLNHVLSLVAMSTGMTGTSITLIKEAVLELTDTVGAILKVNSNDYVDLFSGFYPLLQLAEPKVEKHIGTACELELQIF